MKQLMLILTLTFFIFAEGTHIAQTAVYAGQMLTLSVQINNQNYKQVVVHYKTNRVDNYQVLTMKNFGYNYDALIAIPNENYDDLEYYFSYQKINGEWEEDADRNDLNPYKSRIILFKKDVVLDYELISPEDGEQVQQGEFMLAVSLLKLDPAIAIKNTVVLIDAINISKYCDITEELISYTPPRNFKSGSHNIEIQFQDGANAIVKTISWSFSILSEEDFADANKKFITSTGNLKFSNRSDSYGRDGSSLNYFNGELELEGTIASINYSANVTNSSEHSDTTQNINRYTLNLKQDLWGTSHIRLNIGDISPDYSNLMFAGQNLRGFDFGLMIGINLEFAAGLMNKEIRTVGPNSAYDRKTTLARFSLGKKDDGFALGLNYFRAKDIDFDNSINLMSVNPQDNFNFGLDLLLGFAQNRIKLEVGAVASVFMSNIRGGPIPYTDLKKLGIDSTSLTEDTYNKINDYAITVAGIPDLGATAYFGFGFNFWGQNISLKANYTTADFKSFGNPFARKDLLSIKGKITSKITDQISFNASFGDDHNNLKNDKKIFTSKKNNLEYGISFSPKNEDYPQLRLSIGTNTQAKEFEFDTLANTKNDTKSINASVSKNINYMNLKNNVSVNVSNSLNDNLGNKSNGLGVNLRTTFEMPLTITVGYNSSTSDNSFINRSINNTINLGGDYELIKNDKYTFSVNGALGNTSSTSSQQDSLKVFQTSSESKQTVIDLGAKFKYSFPNETSFTAFAKLTNASFSDENFILINTATYSNRYISFGAQYDF